jgi:hypothetical protein
MKGWLLVIILAARAAGPQEKDGFRTLFNGKDLDGWTISGSARWKVDDGVIVGGQEGDPKRSGFLCTREAFQDFELVLDFMIDEHGKYNSGVYLRNDPMPAGQTGYQVNIGRGAAGEYCGGVVIHKGNGIAWISKGDEKDEVRKPLEWNSMRILAKGPHLVVDLNGKNIVDVTDPEPKEKFLQKGILALQTYGAEGHSGWVKFRNVSIRELK